MRENNFFFLEKVLTNELFLVNIKHQFIALIREKPRHRNYCNFFLSNQKNKKLTVALFFFIFIFLNTGKKIIYSFKSLIIVRNIVMVAKYLKEKFIIKQ